MLVVRGRALRVGLRRFFPMYRGVLVVLLRIKGIGRESDGRPRVVRRTSVSLFCRRGGDVC